jgi:large subunit ribosomal protein L4
MELSIVDSSGNPAGAIDVADGAFGADFKPALVHQVVTAFMAGGRSGTKAQKTRAEVRGGGRKPWRQKGTGHARAGTTRGPIWRTGGVTFAAKPRDYSQKVNRKMYRAAMRCVVSELVREGRLLVVDDFSVSSPKTRDLVAQFGGLGVRDVLVVAEEPSLELLLASRNLHWAAVVESADLNPVTLMAFEKVVITKAALKVLEERLA